MAKVSAPSNIALIKYMGKTDHGSNRPSNASLSWTLEHLRTFVEVVPGGTEDRWEPLPGDYAPFQMTDKGRAKFLRHFQRLKSEWGVQQACLVRSANNFPSDCGLASSASSFAALTLAAAETFRVKATLRELSELSRLGSGSSCRSFFSPWALWEDEGAKPVELPQKNLLHLALIIESEAKSVSSSEAHRRVVTSPRFSGRPERANIRLQRLLQALRQDNWQEAWRICREEYIDMHELFETAQDTFRYRNEKSEAACKFLDKLWEEKGDGPLVTMDAGPNIHLLFRPEQKELAVSLARDFASRCRVIPSWSGT